jgi:hypothetical protein
VDGTERGEARPENLDAVERGEQRHFNRRGDFGLITGVR